MTVTSTTNAAGSAAASPTTAKRAGGLGSLGQADFLRLMTEQLKQQDPFQPVDNQQMLAQMAQFSSLAATSEMGATLKDIAGKLDALTASQTAFLKSAAALGASGSSPSPAATE